MSNECCEVESCNNEAEYYDHMDNQVCEEHMNQDIEEGTSESDDYEKIEEDEKIVEHKCEFIRVNDGFFQRIFQHPSWKCKTCNRSISSHLP